jgi:hypothetical protein
MPRISSEYLVTYAVKEWLITHKWDILAYNPPGSQGTFTIPNPNKDPNFRGQTGSESPDIVATKQGVILVVEAKTGHSTADETKVDHLFADATKMEIFQIIIRKVAEANHIFLPSNLIFVACLANAENPSVTSNLGHFKVELVRPLNPSNIEAEDDYRSYFNTVVSFPPGWPGKIKTLFEK